MSHGVCGKNDEKLIMLSNYSMQFNSSRAIHEIKESNECHADLLHAQLDSSAVRRKIN
jgi:hypothetical protein